jgi:NADPH:quinone reductase-like Zn-dependent oxidoreductase
MPTVPVPEMKPGEVLVRVHAVGINPPDCVVGHPHRAVSCFAG